MARSSKQKMKILLVMRELLEKTDEQNPVSTEEFIRMLNQNGISAERKGIYDDIETLKDFGIDIEYRRDNPRGYYVASREFELPELKLLVDAVQCAKFITENKSKELIKKLEKLASKKEATQLQRQVVIARRGKTVNESIYYHVDKIHTAINENKKVRFQYYEWTIRKEMHLRRNGKFYEISPFQLTWDDENYYMIGYDTEADKIKHYRVDKMKELEVLRERREGRKLSCRFDIAEYSKKTFGMFGGEEDIGRLVCKNKMIGVMIDRFGKEAPIYPAEEGYFTIIVKVSVSPQFFGWIFGLGDAVRIESPVGVAQQFQRKLETVAESYRK